MILLMPQLVCEVAPTPKQPRGSSPRHKVLCTHRDNTTHHPEHFPPNQQPQSRPGLSLSITSKLRPTIILPSMDRWTQRGLTAVQMLQLRGAGGKAASGRAGLLWNPCLGRTRQLGGLSPHTAPSPSPFHIHLPAGRNEIQRGSWWGPGHSARTMFNHTTQGSVGSRLQAAKPHLQMWARGSTTEPAQSCRANSEWRNLAGGKREKGLPGNGAPPRACCSWPSPYDGS